MKKKQKIYLILACRVALLALCLCLLPASFADNDDPPAVLDIQMHGSLDGGIEPKISVV